MSIDINVFNDFIHLFYPRICLSCNAVLIKQEKFICYTCQNLLPKAYFHKDIENSIIRKKLFGRVPVFGSAAYYLFSKKTGVQNILHHIKYKQGKELAQYVGSLMGDELLKTEWFKELDGLVPIPLHPKKQLERGYNQSEEYCKGIQKTTEKSILPILSKNIYTSTQTQKKRYERWENVKNNFILTTEMSTLQHIALVDDVMTTGSTFEAAYNTLFAAGYKGKISIITIAVATHLI